MNEVQFFEALGRKQYALETQAVEYQRLQSEYTSLLDLVRRIQNHVVRVECVEIGDNSWKILPLEEPSCELAEDPGP